MFPSALLTAGLALGQAGPYAGVPAQPAALPVNVIPLDAPVQGAYPGAFRTAAAQETAPAPVPAVPQAMPAAPGTVVPAPIHAAPAAPAAPAPVYSFPAVGAPAAPCTTCAPEEEPEAPADKWFLMRKLEGTALGCLLDKRRISISGWTENSYTWSTTDTTNQPVVWNDRANKWLLNQHWIRIEKAVDTEADSATFGWRLDNLIGTDYRFSLMRGLLNEQLENANGNQNLYGYDPIQFYVNAYLPNLFQGTDIRVGRLWTPFGYESLEGVSAPFVSRSYAFNWCPPFTHMGIMASPQFTDKVSGKFMLANGNDVFFDSSQEVRFVGALSYTGEKNALTFGTSIGRGKFNTGEPYAPATVGLQTEPAGRNNINVFDLVWTHSLGEKASYAFEYIYGYQTGVPANVAGGIIDPNVTSGTAHWMSWVQYLNYNFTDKLTGIVRFELFDDCQGQRTGFEGLYTAITGGFQYRPIPDIIIRPEVRYDYNNYSTPFEGRHGIFTSAIDFIVRW